ncbi:MAG: tail protein X [Planctomycetaceae bacterium]|nr:tail protein X [Planctomycetaceae bacterium]
MRTHRIVDGDTLDALAERYLGSASREGEIFAANRDVLMDPKLLPIGAMLKIPPRDRLP